MDQEKVQRIKDAGLKVDGIAYRDAYGWWCIGCGGSVVTKGNVYVCLAGCK